MPTFKGDILSNFQTMCALLKSPEGIKRFPKYGWGWVYSYYKKPLNAWKQQHQFFLNGSIQILFWTEASLTKGTPWQNYISCSKIQVRWNMNNCQHLRLFEAICSQWGYLSSIMLFEVNEPIWGQLGYSRSLRSFEVNEAIWDQWGQ